MKVKEILGKKGSQVWTLKSSQTLQEAVDVLANYHIGALVILDAKGNVEGIISERDIVRECHRNGQKFLTSPVCQVMTKRLLVGSLEDDLDYIMGIMTQNRVRHVPIVTDGKLEGMISIGDVVKAQLDDREYENHYLKNYMFGTSLEENR
jgi:CBS domain-containing protein